MSALVIIREIFYIGIGILIIVLGAMYSIEWYYFLVGVGLVVWGIWDIYKEVRDLRSKSEVSQMREEREEIRKKIDAEK